MQAGATHAWRHRKTPGNDWLARPLSREPEEGLQKQETSTPPIRPSGTFPRRREKGERRALLALLGPLSREREKGWGEGGLGVRWGNIGEASNAARPNAFPATHHSLFFRATIAQLHECPERHLVLGPADCRFGKNVEQRVEVAAAGLT